MGYWFGLYYDDLYWKIKNNCDLAYADFDPISDECAGYVNRFNELVNQINIYDVLGKCYSDPAPPAPPASHELYSPSKSFLKDDGTVETFKNFFTAREYTPFLYKVKDSKRNLKVTPPCVYASAVINYFNSPSVK